MKESLWNADGCATLLFIPALTRSFDRPIKRRAFLLEREGKVYAIHSLVTFLFSTFINSPFPRSTSLCNIINERAEKIVERPRNVPLLSFALAPPAIFLWTIVGIFYGCHLSSIFFSSLLSLLSSFKEVMPRAKNNSLGRASISIEARRSDDSIVRSYLIDD